MRDVYLDVSCDGKESHGVGEQNRDLIVGNPYKGGCIVRFDIGEVGSLICGVSRTYSTIKLKVGWVC